MTSPHPVADEDTGERIFALAHSAASGVAPTSDELVFVERVAALVDEPGATRGAEDFCARVSRLSQSWKQGSRMTGEALIASDAAEEAGDLARARSILSEAAARIRMPFYVSVLSAAIRALAARTGG